MIRTNFNTSASKVVLAGAMLLIFACLSSQTNCQANPQQAGAASAVASDKTQPDKQVKLADVGRFGGESHGGRVKQRLSAGRVEEPVPGPKSRPPRGYCVKLSRAIKPTSRCYKHLVPLSTTIETGASNGPESRAKIQDPTVTPTLSGNNNNLEQRRRRRHSREELVYVRLETLGDKITNLSTQVMNERVLDGLLNELLLQPTESDPRRGLGGEGGGEERGEEDLQETKQARIFGSSASASASTLLKSASTSCQVAMEKFLCRLVYPSCHFRQTDVGALVRPPCREDCLLLRDSLCSNLNWLNFSHALQRAFNVTLTSTINAIDLIADGDPRAVSAIPRQVLVSKLLMSSTSSEAQGGHNSVLTESNAHSSWALSSYNLSSSLHFYWPHEKSMERCESLPPLRTMMARLQSKESAAGAAANEMLEDHHEGHKFATSSLPKWMIVKKHRHWPICSNAHLTEIRADETGAIGASKSVVDNENEELSAGKKPSSDKTTMTQSSHSKKLTDKDCLSSSYGSYYMGLQNTTRSGLLCQHWTSKSPHKHKMSELLFDNMREANNYCRNPGGLELMPWCYTMDPGVRWEYCNITAC